jgi:hypothetical protein
MMTNGELEVKNGHDDQELSAVAVRASVMNGG